MKVTHTCTPSLMSSEPVFVDDPISSQPDPGFLCHHHIYPLCKIVVISTCLYYWVAEKESLSPVIALVSCGHEYS